MSISRQEWREQLKRKTAEAAHKHIPQLRLVEQAEVEARKLTGEAHWDLLLRHIQAAVNWAEEQERQCADLLFSSTLTDVERAKVRDNGIRAQQTKLILNAVMEMPAAMQKDGEKARGLLEIIGSEETG